MSHLRRRRPRSALLTVCAAVFVAALAAAPGASASSLSLSGGTLTYTPSSADTAGVTVTFGEPAGGSVEVRTYDADAIASAPGCTDNGPSSGATSDFTCAGVTALVANGTAQADSLSDAGDSGPPAIPPVSGIPAVLNGGAGDDTLTGGPGNETLNGGAGDDTLTGDITNLGTVPTTAPSDHDVLNGGDGTDTLWPSNGPNQVSGGAGVDEVDYYDNASSGGSYDATGVNVSLDGQANDGHAGENSNIGTDVEDVTIQETSCTQVAPAPCAYGDATLTGDDGPNFLSGGSGNDTLTGGGGGDFLSGHAGNNTLNGVNGYPDRLDCGGIGTANADQLDTVVGCTTTNRTTLSDFGLITQDRAPTISWRSPKERARVNPSKANIFQVSATPGTHPITRVAYYVGERTACIVQTPPYTCAYKGKDSDVGKDALVAIATDSIGLTATRIRTITVTAFKPRKLSASTRPRRIEHAPYRFTTTGRLRLPAGVSANHGCTGRVMVAFKAGSRRVGGGAATLRRSCTYSSRVTVVFATGLGRPRTLTVSVTFAGNRTLTKASARSYKVRVS